MGEPTQLNVEAGMSENDFERVRKILLDTWDPLGKSEKKSPEDKYDAYVEKVGSMAMNGAGVVEISFYLNNVELWMMGLRKLPEARSKAARAVLDYFLEKTKNHRFQIQGAF